MGDGSNQGNALLVGTGNPGTALSGDNEFRRFGLRIVVAFDVASSRVGGYVHAVPMRPLSYLMTCARRQQIHIGIITLSVDQAPSVADRMAESGISAIRNFAPTRLHVPPDVTVQNEDLYNSLAAYSHRLAVKMQNDGAQPSFDSTGNPVMPVARRRPERAARVVRPRSPRCLEYATPRMAPSLLEKES
jgi:NADH/NAD ratio-sensing transcriptional regulator Rex